MEKILALKNIARFWLKIMLNPGQRKYANRWLLSRKKNYLLNAPSPWLTFDAITYLERFLSKGSRIFEYGSGGSTLFWLKFEPLEVVSVEHDNDWFVLLSRRLGRSQVLDYRLVPAEKSTNQVLDPSNPLCYQSEDASFKDCNFKKYASQIDDFPDDYFDAILIDGRARPSCIMHSVSKVKINGLLVLDNAERLYYTSQTQIYLEDFTCRDFYGVGPQVPWMWQTNVYVREK